VKRTATVLLSLCVVLAVGTAARAESVISVIQDGGDRLVETQNTDGGWGWPLTGTSAVNTIGPIGAGLVQAYLATGDSNQYAALQSLGTYFLTKTTNFSPSDGYLAVQLDGVFGGTTYTDFVKTNFYDQLAAGTYNRNGAGTLYDTATYIQLIHNNRASAPNMAAWDIGMGCYAAALVGADTTAWQAGVEAEINNLDSENYYDVLGLAGAVLGLAAAGDTDFDPTSGSHAAASSLADLADILASYQIDASGGFAWNAAWVIDNDGDEAVQETAYAILALNEVDREGYMDELLAASAYLRTIQLETGGWQDYQAFGTYTGSGENNEVTGEALWGIGVAPEPATMGLLMLGGVGTLVRRMRRG